MFREDIVQLDQSMLFFDALFRWARDGMNESHDWPTSKGYYRDARNPNYYR